GVASWFCLFPDKDGEPEYEDGMIDTNVSRQCLLCGARADVQWFDHPGYQEPLTFNIIHCENCNTSFPEPQSVNHNIYDRIYSIRSSIPAYNRYERYAREVRLSKNPLDYLANSENVYWAIREYFNQQSSRADRKVLEVGSGLGYLTYSLNMAGINTVGIDISAVAVDEATKRFGNYFSCQSVEEHSKNAVNKYDVVILTEVIEHVCDISSLIEAIKLVLVEGGDIVITTPNKSNYPSHALWCTDPPPVHVWWLSEESFRYLSKTNHLSLKYIDFTKYNQSWYRFYAPNSDLSIPTRKPILDAKGSIRADKGALIYSFIKGLERFGLRNITKIVYITLLQITARVYIFIRKPDLRRSDTLCAVLTK
ncbi:MAG TPA: class I SAM-dependent methyltransferase, partial [Roseiflexaceae bacterium]|nr:class I SAM-dependent methyltransferase [Roseiflexaceae bacterium]